MDRLFVCYVRVSTREQGDSRLGLDAQWDALRAFLTACGGICVREFEDVSSARRHRLAERPVLRDAIAVARRAKATILVARLDRLSRSVALTALLLGSDVPFEIADMPGASRVSLHLAAVMAEYESNLTSIRTKAAMRAARERGADFSRPKWRFTVETRRKAAEGSRASHINRALEAYADIAPIAAGLREGERSWTEIAAYLNGLGHTTRSGRPWSIHTAQSLVRRHTDVAYRAARFADQIFDEVVGDRHGCAPRNYRRVASSRNATPTTVAVASIEPRASCKAIVYLRVSTRMQGATGLGIEAQRASAGEFAERSGLNILGEYVDVDSAWHQPLEKRPILLEALAHARAVEAILVIARLDRLARNPSVVHALIRSRINFVCADAPWADHTTIALLAVLAERESELISARMREVRAQAKATGRSWRHVNNLPRDLQPAAVRRSAEIRTSRTRERYAYVKPIAAALRAEGLSYRKVARELTARGLVNQRGGVWTDVSTRHLLLRPDYPNMAI